MPRTPEDNQQIRDARREEILRAAANVFATQGYGQTKISDIAVAASCSHGLVYQYFTSKEEIFRAIVEEAMQRVMADLTLTGPTAMARLEAIVDRVLERITGAPEVGVLLSQVFIVGGIPDLVAISVASHVAHFQRVWIDLIQEGQRSGEITREASPEELAGMLLCAVRGLSIVAHGTQNLPKGAAALPIRLPTRTTILRFLRPSVADSAAASERSPARKNVKGPNATPRPRTKKKSPRSHTD